MSAWIKQEIVYVTIGNPAFCLFLCLTGVHFLGELHLVGDVSEQKIKRWPIRTREIGGFRLKDGLYDKYTFLYKPPVYKQLACGTYFLSNF